MQKRITRLLSLFAVLTALSLWSLAALAQDRDEQQVGGKTTTVTGCLAKGDSPNEFYLTADDGTKYEVRSDSVSLADHVGHKVTVKGTAGKESEAQEKEENEKNEAREGKAANLQVTDLQMISSSCK